MASLPVVCSSKTPLLKLTIARKLEGEQKKMKEGGAGGEKLYFSSPPPLPSPFIPLFSSCPNFFDELPRKRLLSRLAIP